MQNVATRLEGPILIRPVIHGDERGFFHESYRRNVYADLGIPEEFVQDNHSRSGHGIVRGMHFQVGRGAAKLVRCATRRDPRRRRRPPAGLADLRRVGGVPARRREPPPALLPGRLRPRLLRPSDVADVMYKCAPTTTSAIERGIAFDDPDVGIAWPVGHRADAVQARQRGPAAVRDRGRAAVRLRGPRGLAQATPAARPARVMYSSRAPSRSAGPGGRARARAGRTAPR